MALYGHEPKISRQEEQAGQAADPSTSVASTLVPGGLKFATDLRRISGLLAGASLISTQRWRGLGGQQGFRGDGPRIHRDGGCD